MKHLITPVDSSLAIGESDLLIDVFRPLKKLSVFVSQSKCISIKFHVVASELKVEPEILHKSQLDDGPKRVSFNEK